jgi:hypothetical protein
LPGINILAFTAEVPGKFCNFYSAKNHTIAINSATTKAGEKISADLESSEVTEFSRYV